MTDQQISALINALRYTNQITPLQKDILDTWDALQKKPFDADAAQEDMIFNLRRQLDGLAAKEMEAHINGYFG